MEKLEKQCTVVFALIVTEPLVSVCVCVERVEGGCYNTPPLPINRFSNHLCKDDIAMFSRFLYGYYELSQNYVVPLD